MTKDKEYVCKNCGGLIRVKAVSAELAALGQCPQCYTKTRFPAKWTPSESDKIWMRNLVDSLKIGGVWAAPMGFTFVKTAEHEIRLKSICTTPENLEDVMEAIERTEIVCAEIGVSAHTKESAEQIIVGPIDLMPLLNALTKKESEGKQNEWAWIEMPAMQMADCMG